MLRITNLTDKPITISKNIILNARNYIDVNTTMDSRLYQLMNMNVIKIQEIAEKVEITSNGAISAGVLRRQQMMERIKNGDVKTSISLDVSSYQLTPNSTGESKNKKVKRVNK